MQPIKELFRYILSLLFPPRQEERIVQTLSKADMYTLPEANGAPIGYALFSYKDLRVQALVWEIKYHRSAYAITLGAEIMAEKIATYCNIQHLQEIILISVPVTSQNLRQRTYSQTDLLCRNIVVHLANSRTQNFTYRTDMIKKIRNTVRQNKMKNRSDRLTNLHGAFEACVDSNGYPFAANKNIIIIDDVTTTGATITEIRDTLLAAGATSVTAFTLAH